MHDAAVREHLWIFLMQGCPGADRVSELWLVLLLVQVVPSSARAAAVSGRRRWFSAASG